MSKKWIIGNFITGQVTEADELPVVAGSGKVTLNINSEDYATLSVSKRDLPNPAAWKTYLKPAYRLVALVDTSKAWNAEGAVLFAGFIKEVRATAKQTVALQVAGFREYASNRVVVSAPTGQIADPKASKVFSGSNWSQVLNAIANGVWDATGLPSTAPKPPTATKGTVGSVSGSTRQAEILNVNTMRFSDALDYVRDELSDKGEEYRFVPRWQNSSKNRIVWDFTVGTNAAPQINKTQTFNVNLDSENYTVGLGNSLSLTDFATRLVGISKQTEDTTDFKLYNSGSGADLLIDDVFNPGVELTPAELDTFTTERLNSQKLLQEEGELLVVANADETWRTRVGATVNITGGSTNPEVSGMTFTMRLVEVSFSDSDTKVETRVMMNKTRYGRLPTSPTNPNRFGQNPSLNSGGMGGPITPKLPDNTPPIGGGGGGGIPTIPDWNGGPTFEGSDPFLTHGIARNATPNTYTTAYRMDTGILLGIQNEPISIERTSTTHLSWSDCDTFFNSVLLNNRGITFRRYNLDMTGDAYLYGFSFQDFFPLSSLPTFPELPHMGHSLTPALHSIYSGGLSFVDGDDHYFWALLSKSVYTSQAVNAATVYQTKIFKNSLSSGTSSSWIDLGWDNLSPVPGTIYFPLGSQSITVDKGKLHIVSSQEASSYFENVPWIQATRVSYMGQLSGSVVLDYADYQWPLVDNNYWTISLPGGEVKMEGDLGFTDYSEITSTTITASAGGHWGTGQMEWSKNSRSPYIILGKYHGRIAIAQLPRGGNMDAASAPGPPEDEDTMSLRVGWLGQKEIATLSAVKSYADNLSIYLVEDWFITLATNHNNVPGSTEMNGSYRTKGSSGAWIYNSENPKVSLARQTPFDMEAAGSWKLPVNTSAWYEVIHNTQTRSGVLTGGIAGANRGFTWFHNGRVYNMVPNGGYVAWQEVSTNLDT